MSFPKNGIWFSRAYVRRYVIPANPNSVGQQLTRNTFAFLNDLWKFLPAGALSAWTAHAVVSRYTARNGWLAQNIGPLRTETDLDLMTVSPAVGSGLIAGGIVTTPASGQITVDLTAPTLPTGWTITQAHAMAIRNVDPQTSSIFDAVAGSDVSDPYSIVLAGLTNGNSYLCAGWFEFVRSNGQTAYGVSLQENETPA